MSTPDCPVIQRLPLPERARLLDRGVPRTLVKNQALFLAGEAGERVYVVTEGLLKLCARDAAGNETILGLAGEGDIAGDFGALEGTHPCDGVAATPCSVLALESDLFIEILTAHPRSAVMLARSIAERWRRMADVTLERTTAQVPVRLAGRLLELAEICGRMNHGTIEMQVPLAQQDLGLLSGMCRESTCKTLRRFKEAGVIDYQGRMLRILRPEVLHKIKCAGRGAAPSR